jgi:hypothetical protein
MPAVLLVMGRLGQLRLLQKAQFVDARPRAAPRSALAPASGGYAPVMDVARYPAGP